MQLNFSRIGFYYSQNVFIFFFQGIAKLILLACVLFGMNLWEWMRIPTPPWYIWLSQNKIYGCMMIFFLSNAIEGQLISTGAFEISFNGK